jgi:hypothetical protein
MTQPVLLQNDGIGFTRVAAVACLVSVVTTIGIHAFFRFEGLTFEQRLLLYQDNSYLLNRWWVILHCLLVIIAMAGMRIILAKKTKGFSDLGFIFFVVFGITEIFRQLLVLFYLNGLRRQYLSAVDEASRSLIANHLDNFGLISLSLFGLFILSFGLGNFFYGMGMIRSVRFDRIVGYLLLFWSLGTFLALANELNEIPWLSMALPVFNLYYQPFMRLLLAVWLWRSATTHQTDSAQPFQTH